MKSAFSFYNCKGTPQKDVTIKSDAPDTLLLEKHADYIASYGSKKDDYVRIDGVLGKVSEHGRRRLTFEAFLKWVRDLQAGGGTSGWGTTFNKVDDVLACII